MDHATTKRCLLLHKDMPLDRCARRWQLGFFECGEFQGPADDLAPELRALINRTAKRICRTLELDGYVRIDFRLSTDGVPYFLEANPNPEIAQSEEFAQAADHDGLSYSNLLNRLLGLAIKRQASRDA